MFYTPQDYCRPEVKEIKPYQPGKPTEELRRETGVDDILKLASNENVLGPSPHAIAMIKQYATQVAWYPESQSPELKVALAEHHGIAPECIVIGNGSNEILELIGQCFLHPGASAVYSEHAFAVYALTVQLCAARAQIAIANAADQPMPYGHNLTAIKAQIAEDTRVVFIANPNNPTGTWLEKTAIKDFLDEVPASVIVVIDQAYVEYSKDDIDVAPWIQQYPNLVITQTFSKIFALAGLRIGYALASPEVADLLNRVRQPFNVNTLAPVAALAALEDQAHLRRCVQSNRDGLQELQTGMADLGLRSLPSATNFLCVEIKNAEFVYRRLLEQGIIVRPIANYNLPNHLRITVGLSEHHQRLLTALSAAIKQS